MTWEFDKSKIDSKLNKLLSRKEKYVGDVASYYLPYLEYIIGEYKFTKSIVLKRPKSEVVKSFILKTRKFKDSHWSKNRIEEENQWSKIFLKYDLDDKEKAIGRYWEDYYSEAEKLISKYPGKIRLFNTEDLNSDYKVKQILDFCEIGKKDQKVLTEIKLNKSGDPLFRVKYLFLGADRL